MLATPSACLRSHFVRWNTLGALSKSLTGQDSIPVLGRCIVVGWLQLELILLRIILATMACLVHALSDENWVTSSLDVHAVLRRMSLCFKLGHLWPIIALRGPSFQVFGGVRVHEDVPRWFVTFSVFPYNMREAHGVFSYIAPEIWSMLLFIIWPNELFTAIDYLGITV